MFPSVNLMVHFLVSPISVSIFDRFEISKWFRIPVLGSLDMESEKSLRDNFFFHRPLFQIPTFQLSKLSTYITFYWNIWKYQYWNKKIEYGWSSGNFQLLLNGRHLPLQPLEGPQ